MSNQRLRTDQRTEQLIIELQRKLAFSTKAAIIRLAVALSLTLSENPIDENAILETDKNGADYARYTLTGEEDILFKIAIYEHMGRSINDEAYFPIVFGAHLNRGIEILHSEYEYAGSKDRLFEALIKKGD